MNDAMNAPKTAPTLRRITVLPPLFDRRLPADRTAQLHGVLGAFSPVGAATVEATDLQPGLGVRTQGELYAQAGPQRLHLALRLAPGGTEVHRQPPAVGLGLVADRTAETPFLVFRVLVGEQHPCGDLDRQRPGRIPQP